MKGYIGIANEGWCSHLQSHKSTCAVFWRKKAVIKALQKGEYFYFINRKAIDGKRYVVGRGTYDEWNILSARDAWDIYGGALGYKEEHDFLESIKTIYKTDEVELGCIVLKEVVYFEEPVCLSDCDIDFSPYIVSGKIIDEEECTRLNCALERRS